MKKETEFEPALRQVISQTFIDTPAPRKTRYRIIHPDLNTLKNAEDNLSIVLCVSERKTGLDPVFPIRYVSICYSEFSVLGSLIRSVRFTPQCISMLHYKCTINNRNIQRAN